MVSEKCVLSSVLCILLLIGIPAVADDGDIDKLLDKLEANLLVNQVLARKLSQHAEQIIAEKALIRHKPRLLNFQAHLFILSYDLNNAYIKAEEAADLATTQQNKLQLAEAIRRKGIINYLLGFESQAIELLTESLRLHSELESRYLLNSIHAIGNVYNSNPQWVDSLIDIGEQLIEKAITQENAFFEEQGYHFVAAGLIKKGEFQRAAEFVTNAITTLGKEDTVLLIHAASAQNALQNYSQALSHINAFKEFAIKRNNPLELISTSIRHAEILLASGQNNEGEAVLLSALEKVNEVNYAPYQQQILQKLAEHYERDGQSQQAITFLRQYYELKELEFNNKQNQKLAFSRARLEVEQKTQQITELELSQKIAAQQNSFQFYIIVLSSIIIVLLLIFYLRSNQQKRKLQLYSNELKQATEAKSQFLARMSHEIRTPINAIIGLTKLSRKQQLTPEQQDVNLQQIEDSSLTLLGVINDILDFSKIEAGKMDIEHAAFELDKVIDQATRLQTLKAQEKGLEIIQYIARDVPLNIIGDALRLQQVLNNLISNAVKFTRQGVISVTVNRKYSESGLRLELSVKDTGIGLTEKQVDRLFDSFSQADESTTRQFGGTGLGLAICKQLAELMGGKIWVESHPGQGATFFFTILVEEDTLPQKATAMSEAKLSDLKVLVVDDIDLCRQAADEVLSRVKIAADLVASGFKAIEKIRLSVEQKEPYDLILLDWQMPELDGIEVASMINQEFTRNKPKIVMLSAYDMKSLQEIGGPMGINYYLEKPIHNSNLINLIMELMNENRSELISPSVVQKKASHRENQIPDLTGKKLLLVEDNKLNRKVAVGFLADTFATIAVAENGQIALDMLTQQPKAYDVIFMDVQMPVMDGLTASQKIRKELQLSIPIIAMTANAMQGDIENCIAAGMNAHIPKPIDPDYMFEVLSQFVAADQPQALPDSRNATQISEDETAESILRVNRPKAISKLKFNEKLYEGLITDFIAMQPQLTQLTDAVKMNDINTVNRIIHTFKSSVSYVGAYELEKMARQIEQKIHGLENGNDLTEEVAAEINLFSGHVEHLILRLQA